jgi:cytochrome c-type biogenesis protein
MDVAHNSLTRATFWTRSIRAGTVLVLFVLMTAIAGSWLIFPYFVKDQNLLQTVGGDVKQERLRNAITVGQLLTRTTFGVGEAQVDMLYAPPRFFEVTDRADAVRDYRPDLYHVFLVTETTHIDDLPEVLPDARLFVDDREIDSHDVEGPLLVYHHRVLTVRFPRFDAAGDLIVNDTSRELRLELDNTWDPGGGTRTATWQLPIKYPDHLENATVWTPLMVLGISAGLLSFVLTPCLLQLIVVFVASVAGFTADHSVGEDQNLSSSSRRIIIRTAFAFVIGFSTLFTVTGAAIGHAGKQAQMFFSIWSPTLTIIAGIVVIAMGLWVGIRSKAPIICKLVPSALQSRISESKSIYGAALTAAGFSLGCLTCFGGAIIATLLVYVGAIGSALVGAAMMLAFSLGVVIPFMLAAVFLSRAMPLLVRIQQSAPQIGFVSMLIMVAFGIILLTDNFHTVSDFIYPFLGLA